MRIASWILTISILSAAGPLLAAEPAAKTHEFEVSGMTCKLCPIRIEKGLETLDGVSSVEADVKTGLVRVVADTKVSAASLEAAIEGSGPFEAEIVAMPEAADPS